MTKQRPLDKELKEKQEFPKIGVHQEIITNPTFAFKCFICDGSQEVYAGSSRTLFPVCDKCVAKLKVLLRT